MVDLSFSQLLIMDYSKRGIGYNFSKKKKGARIFRELKKGAATFFNQIKRGRRVFSPTKNPENPARVPRKFWFVPKMPDDELLKISQSRTICLLHLLLIQLMFLERNRPDISQKKYHTADDLKLFSNL